MDVGMVPLSTFAYNDNRFNVADILLVKNQSGMVPYMKLVSTSNVSK